MSASLSLRLKAAAHELRCRECRVTWRSWLQRIANRTAGFSPALPSKDRARPPTAGPNRAQRRRQRRRGR